MKEPAGYTFRFLRTFEIASLAKMKNICYCKNVSRCPVRNGIYKISHTFPLLFTIPFRGCSFKKSKEYILKEILYILFRRKI